MPYSFTTFYLNFKFHYVLRKADYFDKSYNLFYKKKKESNKKYHLKNAKNFYFFGWSFILKIKIKEMYLFKLSIKHVKKKQNWENMEKLLILSSCQVHKLKINLTQDFKIFKG